MSRNKPKRRISTLLNQLQEFSLDDSSDSTSHPPLSKPTSSESLDFLDDNNSGQNALNELLSKSKKGKERTRPFIPSRQDSVPPSTISSAPSSRKGTPPLEQTANSNSRNSERKSPFSFFRKDAPKMEDPQPVVPSIPSTRREQPKIQDSDTDIEEEKRPTITAPKYSPKSSFILSETDISQLANVLKSIDPTLPYPSATNLLFSLKRIAMSQSSLDTRTDDRYLALQKEYRRARTEVENLSFKLQELKSEHVALAKEKMDMESDMTTLKERYEDVLQSSNAQYEQFHKKDKARKDLDVEIELLKEQHAREMNELKSESNKRERRIRTELEEEINTVSEQADKEIKDMQAMYQEKIKKLEKELEHSKYSNQEKMKKTMQLEHDYELDKIKSQSREEIERAKRDIERENQSKLLNLQDKIRKLGLESAQVLERELEKAHAESIKEQENLSLKHHQDMDRMREQFSIEKNELKAILDRTQNQLNSTQSQFALETDQLNEKIDSLSLKSSALEAEKKDLMTQLKTIHSQHSKELSTVQSELDRQKTKVFELTSTLEKERELILSLKRDVADKEAVIQSLSSSIEDYQRLHDNIKELENRHKQELSKKDDIISSLEASMNDERLKVKRSIDNSIEEKEFAMDQVERIKKRLAATESDLSRAKEAIDDKDNEILDLKRLLRSQNKQLEEALGGMKPELRPTEAYKKLSETESQLEIVQSQVQVLKKQLLQKDKEMFELRIEASEGKDKSLQVTEMQQKLNDKQSELESMQLMMLELKTSKVQLLERVDNAEHKENILKSELSLVKAELERFKMNA